MTGYDIIKQFHKMTEDETEAAYFDLLRHTFAALNDAAIPLSLVRLWFGAQALQLNGHTPNLQLDTQGVKLSADTAYDFDFDAMAFTPAPRDQGRYAAGHIKLLRLVFDGHAPATIAQVRGSEPFVAPVLTLVDGMRRHIS